MRIAVHGQDGVVIAVRDTNFEEPPAILAVEDELYNLAGVQDGIVHYTPRDK